MDKDATTPLVEPKSITPTLPAVSSGPQTYEDSVALIEQLQAEPDLGNIKTGLNKLHTFFKTRIGKRAAEKAKDGGEAVRTAISTGRNFKAFEPKAVTPPGHINENPWK